MGFAWAENRKTQRVAVITELSGVLQLRSLPFGCSDYRAVAVITELSGVLQLCYATFSAIPSERQLQ